MNNKTLWQTKLAARIHDPAEKALVLLRDPAGHEGGTSRALTRLLNFGGTPTQHIDPDNAEALSTVLFKKGIPAAMYRHVQRADWWAAAADRPQWPMEEVSVTTKAGGTKTFKVADWAQVRWTQKPVLIHPLTGAQIDLGKTGGLGDTDFHDIKQRSFDHFAGLLTALGQSDVNEDPRKTLLTYWRFGPELTEETDNGKLGSLWRMLPADTRVPDHSIWDHLDLTSAFAGAFAADPDGDVALLSLAIGPVQSFIAAARSTSDLWAGSHLLSRLAWEAMKPVCESLGPDAIIFPRLRGVPQVDLWLRDEMKLPPTLFESCEWMRGGTDANPLFSAALPNRFVAIVPASQARALAQQVSDHLKQWLQKLGQDVVNRLLAAANLDNGQEQHCHRQAREQLAGFPEVHWAAVPFSLITARNTERQTDLDVTLLSQAMAPFFGVTDGQPCGFLKTPAWQSLAKETPLISADGKKSVFFAPNPGVLYPAIHDLAERTLAAAKAVRPFKQSRQTGWRCSLTGEVEWLTTDASQLQRSYRLQKDTLWAKISKNKKAWAKSGEHLGALSAIKRLWPTVFAEEVGQALNQKDIGRFVVSTHTMALAHQIDQWLQAGGVPASDLDQALKSNACDPVALPRRIMRRHAQRRDALDIAKRLPALLDMADESEDDPSGEGARASAYKNLVRKTLGRGDATYGKSDQSIQLETYYALLLMDGDRMGKWLAGDEEHAISYRDSFHPQVQKGLDSHAQRQPAVQQYATQKRALSPNRHLAISGALNDFSLTVVRHVIEEEHLGRVIYAGGDDVLAMLPVADLLDASQRLRHAYSGTDPEHEGGRDSRGLTLHNGFAILNHRLMRMMGSQATASCGAVVAHHQAPLTAVMRELRAAESRAKSHRHTLPSGKVTDRDTFSLTVIKRSGGALYLSIPWGEPVRLLGDLRDFLKLPGVSRRAVYNTLAWLRDLPEPTAGSAMLQSLLQYQMDRQVEGENGEAKRMLPELAQRLAQLTLTQHGLKLHWLENFLTVAEFLARETRTGVPA